jgi:hypothetical protein
MPRVNKLRRHTSTRISWPDFYCVFMFSLSTSQKTTFLSLEPEANCMLCRGFQATAFTASPCPAKL